MPQLILGVVVAILLLVYFNSTSDHALKKTLKKSATILALGILLIPVLIWGTIKLGPFALLVLAIFLALRWLVSPFKSSQEQKQTAALPHTAEPSTPSVESSQQMYSDQPTWIDQNALEQLQKRLLIEPLELVKLSMRFNCTIRTKLADCLSFGDERALQNASIASARAAFVADFNQFKKTIVDHPLHGIIESANHFLASAGAEGVSYSVDLSDIQADENVEASNPDFVRNMETATEKLLAYIEKINAEACQLHEKLSLFKSGMEAQARQQTQDTTMSNPCSQPACSA